MKTLIPEFPFLRYVGFMLTLKCEVECPHCAVRASPRRREVMLYEDICNWISQLAEYRAGYTKALALTGGEPFYDIHLLRFTSDMAVQAGMVVSVVTNAYWASDLKKAACILAELPSIGILSISTDQYHLNTIPLDWVRNAAAAADARGLPWTLSVCTQSEQDPEHLKLMAQIKEFASSDQINVTTTVPIGRGYTSLDRSKYKTVSEPAPYACTRSSTPVIFPDGRVLACIGPIVDLPAGHPLELGNLRYEKISDVFQRAEKNVLLHALRMWGPSKLISMLSQTGLENELPTTYIRNSLCDACYSLFVNPALSEPLNRIANDQDFALEVACSRVQYVHEPEMLESMGLVQR